jgi:hypothetical protein
MQEILVTDKAQLRGILQGRNETFYLYILRNPDGIPAFDGIGTPFYVGKGQGARVFSHVEDARDGQERSPWLDRIRDILKDGRQVVHAIRSFHVEEPWIEEDALMRLIGLVEDGTGPLLNSQTYSPSHKVNGVELRKYAATPDAHPDRIPDDFRLLKTRLMAGPRDPGSRTSVFGKIFTTLEQHPGVTGEELVQLLKRLDFSKNKSPYTQSGEVCAEWLCRYIEGGYFRADRLHLQAFKAETLKSLAKEAGI